ncbi:MAG: STAS domain-containing protein [Leptospiraceae bacterium]|nr:STAS domain-containing protein [Leptospiraceae bacterium]MCB1305327.1 STAS domain-containing protein [Leptospiraceae bacterium]
MDLKIEKQGNDLLIRLFHPRVDGDNLILRELELGEFLGAPIGTLTIDMAEIEYINSLGITELINIHRRFSESNSDGFKLVLKNVDRKIATILELVDIHRIAEIDTRIQ